MGILKIKYFSRPQSKIQVLFKTIFVFKDFSRQPFIFKYFSSLCEPCRVKALILTIKTILSQTPVSARTFLSLLGKLSAAADNSSRQIAFKTSANVPISVRKPHILSLDHQVPITKMIKFHLKWWMNSSCFIQGMPIHPPDPKIYLYTDATSVGELI